MSGIATSQRRQAPSRLASSASRTRSRSASMPRWPSSLEIPALFTRTSSRPNSSSTKDASRPTLCPSATSSWWTTTWPKSPSAAARPLSSSLEPRITVRPLSASWRQISSPIPRFPPLTSATRPFSVMQPPDPKSVKILHPEDAERRLDGLFGRRGREHVLTQLPALQRHHRASDLAGQPYLGERSVLAADGDYHVARADDRQVPRVPRARGYGVREILVGSAPVLIRQDADGRSTGLRSSAGGGLHDAGETAADDGSASFGDEPADLPGLLVELSGGFAGSDHRYVWSAVHRVG